MVKEKNDILLAKSLQKNCPFHRKDITLHRYPKQSFYLKELIPK